MWAFYLLLILCGIALLRFFFPYLFLEILLPAVCWSFRHILKILRRAVVWVIQKVNVLWNSPDKILLWIFELPGKIFVGLVFLLETIIRKILKIPSGLKKLLTIILRPDSEEKEQKKDVLEDILNYIEGCRLGPPLSKLEIQHLFYIAYYQHYGHVAPDSVVDQALGAYVSRHDMDKLPFWVKSFIREYEEDQSLKTLKLPRWPKFRRVLVFNWRAKNPKEIVSISDFEALPWWMQTLTREHCVEKIDTICLIQDCFDKSVPKKEKVDIQN